MIKEENWKDVVGFNGRYQVSDVGQVRSVDWTTQTARGPFLRKGKVLSPADHKDGYKRISLTGPDDAKLRGHLVHKLVAMAFLGDPPREDSQINHLDRDPKNNRPENLQWTTPKENVNHSVDQGAFHAKGNPRKSPITNRNVRVKLTLRKVGKIRSLYSSWWSQSEIARHFGISQNTVSMIVLNKIWTDHAYQSIADKLKSGRRIEAIEKVQEIRSYLYQGCSRADIATFMRLPPSFVSRVPVPQAMP